MNIISDTFESGGINNRAAIIADTNTFLIDRIIALSKSMLLTLGESLYILSISFNVQSTVAKSDKIIGLPTVPDNPWARL